MSHVVRRIALSRFIIVATALLMSARLAAAATFVVDATNDAVDAAPGDGVCATAGAVCTLRAAIQETNALAGADTVTLPAGTYVLTIAGAGEDFAASGDLDVRSDLTITGAGAATTIVDGNALDRVFQTIGPTSISGITISGGSMLSNCGGGILHWRGALTLTDVIVTGNQAARGGGICNQPFITSILTMTNVVVSGNVALTTGGGVINETLVSGPPPGLPIQGVISMTDCLIAGNHATDGGGIAAVTNGFPPYVELVGTTVRDNVATGRGGGSYEAKIATTSAVHVVRTTISGNVAAVGGGIDGGALIEDSTLSGNRSDGDGGAVEVPRGFGCQIHGTTVTANVADADADGSGDGGGLHFAAPYKCTLGNTILAANQDTGGEAPECGGGDIESEGHNLFGSAAGCLVGGDATGNVDGLDPELGPLAANGGPTFTHALLPGSPATDAGLGCSATDQRGVARPQGAACDIGAVELAYVATSCGNGAIDGGEACDDGNVRDGDCCNHLCQLEASGSACSDGNPCSDDTCDGAGTCTHVANTAPCTDASVCTVGAETCAAGSCVTGPPLACDDGNECTTNACDDVSGCRYPLLSGTPCDDGNECTTGDDCHFGSCGGSPLTGDPCDDASACTTGDHCDAGQCVGTLLSCSATCEFCDPADGCVTRPRDDCQPAAARGAHVLVKDRDNDKADGLVWSYQTNGGAGFGTSSSQFEMCIFDETGGIPSLAYGAQPSTGLCGSDVCWQFHGHTNTYKDKSASAGGLTNIKLINSGVDRRLIKLKGKGPTFPVPTLPLVQDPQVTVEFRERGGACWISRFHTAKKNGVADFKASSD